MRTGRRLRAARVRQCDPPPARLARPFARACPSASWKRRRTDPATSPGGLSQAQEESLMTKSKHMPDAIRERDALDRIAQARAYVFAAHDMIEGLSDQSRAAK